MQTIKKNTEKFLGFIESRLFLKITLIWFGIQSVGVAFTTKIGLPPDEAWHTGLIRLYHRDGIDPFISNQAGYYYLGDVTKNVGYLYHYLLSLITLPLSIFKSEIITIIAMRLISVGLGIATLILVSKIAKELKISNLARNLTVFMLANTAMFVFIFGVVNYDSLVIFTTVATIMLMLNFVRRTTVNNMLSLCCVILFGLQVKFAYAPIAIFVVFTTIALLILDFKNREKQKKLLKSSYLQKNKKTIGLLVVLVVLSVSFLTSYGRNFIQYHAINPKCDTVHSLQQCLEYPVYARNKNFRENPILVGRIDRKEFTIKWIATMQQRVFGVFAHKSYSPLGKNLVILDLIFALILISFIRCYKHKTDKYLLVLILFFIGYATILLMTNWASYKVSGRFGVGLQGRYILPVLFIPYLVGAHYLTKFTERNRLFQAVLVAVLIVAFFISSTPTFLMKTDSTWRMSIGATPNR